MSLVISAIPESWGVTGNTLRQISNYSMTKSRPITSMVRQCQLWLYGYVARYPEADPACRVVSERDNSVWGKPRGRPQGSWMGQVDASYIELLGMGRRVCEAMCPSMY